MEINQITLFSNTPFISHSGQSLDWKINCDALSNEDIQTLAWIISSKFDFNEVIGIPTGGTRLATALQSYLVPDFECLLLVDDVLTTGASMKKAYNEWYTKRRRVAGVVIFTRTPNYPLWITPLFELGDKWRQ